MPTIITAGRLPGTQIYQRQCQHCKTVFQFTRDETRVQACGYNEQERVIDCPFPGCNTLLTVEAPV